MTHTLSRIETRSSSPTIPPVRPPIHAPLPLSTPECLRVCDSIYECLTLYNILAHDLALRVPCTRSSSATTGTRQRPPHTPSTPWPPTCSLSSQRMTSRASGFSDTRRASRPRWPPRVLEKLFVANIIPPPAQWREPFSSEAQGAEKWACAGPRTRRPCCARSRRTRLAFLLTRLKAAADATLRLRLPLGILGASIGHVFAFPSRPESTRGRARCCLSSAHRASA
jgi:hypothetical protein